MVELGEHDEPYHDGRGRTRAGGHEQQRDDTDDRRALDDEHRGLEEGPHPWQPRGEIAQRAAGGERDDEAERNAHERVDDDGPKASGQDQVRPDTQGVDRAGE